MSNTSVTFTDRIKAIFAKDKDDFWFTHFSSEEIALKRMDVWQLAKFIEESKVNEIAGTEQKRIVAEYLFKERLAKIQALPVYISIGTAFLGVIVGAWLTAALQKPQEQSKCICEYQSASAAKNSEPNVVDALVPVAPKNAPVSVPANVKEGAAVQNNAKPAEKNKP